MFYGWKLAGIGSFTNLMFQGGVLYVINAFMEPLCEMHGWSRASIGLGLGISSIVVVLAMPAMISAASYLKLRTMMSAGSLLCGLAFIGLGYMTDVRLFTLLFASVWFFSHACGGVTANLLMQRWFSRYQGRAFGVVNMGTSISGAILPFAALVLVDLTGLKAAYTLLGCIGLLACPLSWIMVRDTPAEMGLNVDGMPEAQAPPARAEAKKAAPLTFKQVFQTPATWVIGLTFSAGLMGTSGVVSQLKPHFVDVGMSSYLAMGCVCLLALFGAAGKYLWGWFGDKTNPLYATKFLLLANACSLTFILLPPNVLTTSLFVAAYGLSMGGLLTLFPAIVGFVYGKERFQSAYKYISLFVIFKSLGYPLVGFSNTYLGSNAPAYMLLVVLLFVSATVFFFFKEDRFKVKTLEPVMH